MSGVSGPSLRESSSLAFKKFVRKPILKLLMYLLPSGALDAFYRVMFPIHKQLVRWAYLAINLASLRFLDRARWAQVGRVHAVMSYSLVGWSGFEATDAEARRLNAEKIRGDLIELGVARGGCAALIGLAAFDAGAPPCHLHLFDSYEDLPEPGDQDITNAAGDTGDHVRLLPKGSCLGQFGQVRDLILHKFRLPEERVHFIKGWFGDWYESTKVCLEGLYDKVSPGGSIIIEDYDSCIGAKRAVDEFLAARRLTVTLIPDSRGGRYFEKPRA